MAVFNFTFAKNKDIEYLVAKFDLKKNIDNRAQGLNLNLNSKNTDFSIGQLQRIQILRAILHSKKILLIDEGLSNVETKLAGVEFNLIFFTIETINKNILTSDKIIQSGRSSIIKPFVTINPFD